MRMGLMVVMTVMCGICTAATTELFTVQFDPTRLSTEKRGTMTLFKYRDTGCAYVEHGDGTPVLPCVMVNVVMPKGAQYKSSRISAQTQPVRGTYKMYTRVPCSASKDGEQTAQRFPARLVEFVGQKDIDGYRVFTFRAYPILCQPADFSVTKILAARFEVSYEGAPNQFYPPADPEKEKRIRSMVLNPNAVTTLTEQRATSSSIRRDAPVTGRSVVTRDVFAVPGDQPSAVVSSPSTGQNGDMFDLLKENVYINDDNDIVYAPIRF